HCGIPRRIRSRTQCLLNDLWGRVDRRSHREIHDPSGHAGGAGFGPGQAIPGEVGQLHAYSSCCCGGSAAMKSTSCSILPSLVAPPGEPMSLKKSTFAWVY